MDCFQTFPQFCPCVQETVSVTAFSEVEAGGYGCAVAAEEVEYTCSRQSGCPNAGSPSCPIHQM